MTAGAPLALFLPAVRAWFERALGTPTPVQVAGWPAIAAGQNTLLLAPTGSGKTLAAFLACLDKLWRQPTLKPGVCVLYISPLKALNNDIYRNLQLPLDGVAAMADELGTPVPRIDIAVRTGDTPTAERQRLVRRPPQVLITTPESLHILLTSKAREALRGIEYCIVDEIHALCPNKRGVFLSLLLERLQAINPAGFARIGLSATQRPLEEVARYLGGAAIDAEGNLHPRPVTIVDAGLRKHLDLQVISPVESFAALPEASVWPSIYRRLADEIARHRTTIVFANNRRTVERLTNQLNDYLQEAAEEAGEPILVRAHHGSVALEVRQETEQALKDGRLRAVVATASLELGIDMGTVDLVCQLESTGNVARALQRVGRAGHLVGQQSKGRLLAKTLPDLLNQAVLAAEMAGGRVEELRVPLNCVDVLAQQVIAMVAMEEWDVTALFRLVRQAYPYRQLTPAAFDAVLQMVTGRYQFAGLAEGPKALGPAQQLAALQARMSWDRVHGRLRALPGSQRLALVHGGTIPDTGQYAVYTQRGLRLGELDEEFVYERRVGDAFLLGTNAWKLERIETDRVIVTPVQGAPAMVPFWRGESTGRSYDLGLAQGRFLRELGERLEQPDCLDWLQREYFLEPNAARSLRFFVERQLRRTGCLPTERTLFVEASRDPLGDWQVLLLSPFGRAFHFGLRLALENALRQRLGYRPQCLHHDDGVLIRLTDSAEPVLDLFVGITPENLRELVLEELADSALFALRFRQNAARALMMPSGSAGKRAPLWLQRLRGRDLLQVARRYPDFPIVAETFRECLHDHLDLPRLEQLLRDIQAGTIDVRSARLDGPSPFAANLLFAFTMAFMYQFDGVEAEGKRASTPLDPNLLDQLVGDTGGGLTVDPRALRQVDGRLRGVGQPPRSKAEAAEWLRRLGDVAPSQLEGPLPDFLRELEAEGLVRVLDIAGAREPRRWILTEEAETYAAVFGPGDPARPEAQAAAAQILERFLRTHALVSLGAVLERYPFEAGWAKNQIEQWARGGQLVEVSAPAEPLQWAAPDNFEQLQRSTLSVLRREVITCAAPQWADFVTRWQRVHPATQGTRADALSDVLDILQGVLAPSDVWEANILPARLPTYEPRWLDDVVASGRWTWMCQADQLAFWPREALGGLPPPERGDDELRPGAEDVLGALRGRGGLFAGDLAQTLHTTPATVRAGLWSLLRLGLVTNDRFDVLRRGEPRLEEETPRIRSRGELRSFLRRSARQSDPAWAEGRWELLGWGQPDVERLAFARARLLLGRFGIVSRELAATDSTMPAWRILYEVLSRLELAGEVRRGYFVEGLSGAQFALPEAADQLQNLATPTIAQAPLILLHSLDPANVYGVGAPLDLALLAGGTRPFPRRSGNWIVMQAGRPILLIEQQGRRLTPLPSAGRDELARALALLPALLGRGPRDIRRKLTVETWNDNAVTTTEGREMLESVGFVRDYQAMTLYEVWR